MPVVVTAVKIMGSAVMSAFNCGEIDVSVANVYPTKQILEIIGNILAENDEYCKILLSNDLLVFLNSIYYDQSNTDELLRLEVLFCWMNIAGGRWSQVLFDATNINDLVSNITILHKIQTDVSYETARRSMVIICNFICECNDNVWFFLFYSIRHVSSL